MGASNSAAQQTAEMVNTTKQIPIIQLTPAVINRLENARKLSMQPPPEPMDIKEIQAKDQPSLLQQKSNELQEMQYQKTLKKLESMLGSPIVWSQRIEADLKELRGNLLNCHYAYPKEPLRCYDEAKEYSDFIFREQMKTLLEVKENKCGNGPVNMEMNK